MGLTLRSGSACAWNWPGKRSGLPPIIILDRLIRHRARAACQGVPSPLRQRSVSPSRAPEGAPPNHIAPAPNRRDRAIGALDRAKNALPSGTTEPSEDQSSTNALPTMSGSQKVAPKP